MKVLLAGAGGQLGRCLQDRRPAQWNLICAHRGDLDIGDHSAVNAWVDRLRPAWIINVAAYTAVDQAEREPEQAYAANERGVRNLARAAHAVGARLLHVSTDYVFDGLLSRPYTEQDIPHPINVYGQSKLRGEQAVRDECPAGLVLRTSWLYSEYGSNFVKTMLRLAQAHDADVPAQIRVVNDQFGCPTYAGDLAQVIVDMVSAGVAPAGLLHYCGADTVSWHDFAQRIFHCASTLGDSFCMPQVRAIATGAYPSLAARPAYSALSCAGIEALGIRRQHMRDALPKVLERLLKA